MGQNIEVYQGETKKVAVTVTDADGAALDLTGLDAEWRLTSMRDEVPLVAKTVGAGITFTDAAAGKLEVELGAVDTDQAEGVYRHELRLSGADYAATVLAGVVTVRDSIF